MGAPKGNKYWQMRKTHGRPKKFETPEELWKECCDFFEWIEANPILEHKSFCYQGEVVRDTIPKIRAMTVDGLTLYLGITKESLGDYRERKGYSDVMSIVDAIIRDQKFTGAAADQLNPNIIARDLGLKDKSEADVNTRIESLIKFQPAKIDKDN
jgi:hypothetical protein